jgi:2,5-diamino-6-(ribosylamino)-4(3H)-pyrimidinone 5'-phosphate reductase
MKPKVIVFNAISMDGRIDWFTADIGLFYGLASRCQEDATLAGCDTLLNPHEEIPAETQDDLALLPPNPGDDRPILVVPDSRGRLRSWHYWRKQPYWRDYVVLGTDATPPGHLTYLQQRGIKYIAAGRDHVDFAYALEQLNVRFGVKRVRVDSGGTLNGVLLRSGLVDEVHLLMHPALVGGTTPKSFFRANDLAAADQVISLRLKAVEKQPDDILLLSYEVVK